MIIQVENELDQERCDRNGKNWSDAGYILKVEPAGFAHTP